MGGTNHVGFTQKTKLKIRKDFVINVLDLGLPTYLPRLDLLGLT
jgi:hypothetical protein